MNGVDYFVLGVMALSIAVGAWRGAIREVLHLAGWFAAFGLAYAFAGSLAAQFADWMSEPAYRVVLAWLAIFFGVLVAASLVASLLTEVVRKVGLDGLNRVAGGAIGLARGALVLLVLTLIAGMTKFPQSAWWLQATSAPLLERIALHVRPLLPESLASRISFGTEAAKLQPARSV